MIHYAASVRCPHCGHHFAVCLHTNRPLDRTKHYVVSCPSNASRVRVAAAELRPAQACPERAVVIRETRG
jgi:phage terminase large subunit GpA-like protein